MSMTAASEPAPSRAGAPGIARQVLPAMRAAPMLGIVAATVLVPALAYAAGVAGLLRLAYPAAAFAFAVWLCARHSQWYAGLIVWLFAATPLVRRLADQQTGYDPANPILLAPYLALLVSVPFALDTLLFRRTAPRVAFVLVLASAGYGMALGVLDGRLISGIVDGLKWTAAPVFCLALMSGRIPTGPMVAVAVASLSLAGAAMGLYGVAQFVFPLPWDVTWALAVDIASFGRPEPYQIRVFSTMNSPGSLGIFLLAATVLSLRVPPILAIPSAALALAGLALTQYRAIWSATVLGVLFVVLAGSGRHRGRVGILALGVVTLGALAATGIVEIPHQIETTLQDRVRSLTQLGSDFSGEDRLRQYSVLLDQQTILGEGLALASNARALDGKLVVAIDSGIIEILRSLGVLFGPAFLLGLAAITVAAMRSRNLGADGVLLKAVVLGSMIQMPFGSMHVGENSLPFWLAAGLLLCHPRDVAPVRRPARPGARGPVRHPAASPGS